MFAAYLAGAIVSGACLAARLYLDRMPDQQRARDLFGLVCIGAFALFDLFAVPWLHCHPPELASTGSVVVVSLIWFLAPIYMRFSAVHTAHRLAYVTVTVLGLIAFPTYSVLGRPAEPLCVSAAILLGELIDFVPPTHTWASCVSPVSPVSPVLPDRDVHD